MQVLLSHQIPRCPALISQRQSTRCCRILSYDEAHRPNHMPCRQRLEIVQLHLLLVPCRQRPCRLHQHRSETFALGSRSALLCPKEPQLFYQPIRQQTFCRSLDLKQQHSCRCQSKKQQRQRFANLGHQKPRLRKEERPGIQRFERRQTP